MDNELKDNLKSSDTWFRILYILLFVIAYSVAEFVLAAVVALQLVLVLFTAKKNERLLKLGQSLSTFAYQVFCYLTFNSDYKPYPFGAWPKGEPTSVKKAVPAEQESEQKADQ